MTDEPGWTRERIELVKRTVCPKGISDDEFTLFIEQCKRSGLDPLLKQAFCVPRKANIGSKERPNWVEKREFQPAEAGMLARAEQFPDFRGVTAASVRAKDVCVIDRANGTVEHKVSPCAARGEVIGAWAQVRREGRPAVVVWIDIEGYRQNSPLWGKIPDRMAEKCALVAGLRQAYPGPFGGMYTKEELPDEDAPALPERTTSKTEALKVELTSRPPLPPPPPKRMVIEDADTEPVKAEDVAAVATALRDAPPQQPVSLMAAAAKAPAGPLVVPSPETKKPSSAEMAKAHAEAKAAAEKVAAALGAPEGQKMSLVGRPDATPGERIKALCEQHGMKMGSVLKGCGIKATKMGDLTAADLGLVRDAIEASHPPARDEPPPPSDEDVPF